MRCHYCRRNGVYRCRVCGRNLCAEHSRLQTSCPSCITKAETRHVIYKLKLETEKKTVRRLTRQIWGEAEQLTFGIFFDVAELPAYVAKVDDRIVGFASFAESDKGLIIVALGVKPDYQGSGIGKSLVGKIEAEARKMRKETLLVSTSNDDLPALAFYQSIGFQIYEVKPNAIAEKHGGILEGIGGLPVRDEIRLQKAL